MDAVVVDYGIVNLKNVVRGLEHVGARVTVSADPKIIERADRVILPGVGAFSAGMNELHTLGLDDALKNFAIGGRPILGICLGMQMLLSYSLEYGHHEGLGLITGSVLPIPIGDEKDGGKSWKVPHIGWTSLDIPIGHTGWSHSCLADTPPGTYFYFVHSFMVVPDDPKYVLGQCFYESLALIGAVRKENITGVQFHPERSGLAGLAVLSRFVST